MARTKSFDFTKIERALFETTLMDGSKLLIKMPSKGLFEKMTSLDTQGSDIASATVLESLDDICAEILSNNLADKSYDPAYVAENFDFEFKMLFLNAYMEFVTGVKDDPN